MSETGQGRKRVKVYCEDCKYYSFFGQPICKHPRFKSEADNPIRVDTEYGDPWKINKKNDCVNFYKNPPKGLLTVGNHGKKSWWMFW